MKLVHFSNQLPPDSAALFGSLRTRSKTNDGALVRIFLHEASKALREEIRRLSPEIRSLFPPFENILDLAEAHSLRHGSLGEAIDGVLLCVLHLGLFIR
jgi:hypothetical protein